MKNAKHVQLNLICWRGVASFNTERRFYGIDKRSFSPGLIYGRRKFAMECIWLFNFYFVGCMFKEMLQLNFLRFV